MDIDACFPGIMLDADDVVQETPIQMLNIDTLLVIFNLLSLHDKLMAMRVCKTWHKIISNHHAWIVIDFSYQEDGPQKQVEDCDKRYKRFVSNTGPNLFEYREFGNPWMFLKTEANVLKFLKLYAGGSLQELYIGGDTGGIIKYDQLSKYLERNCLKIKVLDIPIYCKSNEMSFLSNLQCLKKLKLYFHPSEYSFSSDIQDQYISYISNLAEMKILSKMTQLRELDINITDTLKTADLFTNFESTIGKLVFLQVFRLTLSTKGDFKNFDKILIAISHWTQLEILALCVDGFVCRYTREAFETMVAGLINLKTLELEIDEMVTHSVFILIGTHLNKLKALKLCDNPSRDVGKLWSEEFGMMISGFLHLESLELSGGFVTSLIVDLLGIHLKNLKSLQLSCGSFYVDSLQTLSHHPTLENISVMQSYQDEDNWIGKVYRVLATLLKIRKVKMRVRKLEFEDIKNINLVIDSAEVQVIVDNELWVSKTDSKVIAKEKKWKRVNAK